MRYKNLTTSDLVEKCISKDALAWAEFVSRFSPLILFSVKKVLAKYSANPDTAREEIKDIQQNIMLSLWGKNKLAEVREKENISYWLAITARNAAINHLRAKSPEVLITDDSFFDKVPVGESGEETRSAQDAYKNIEESYGQLSAKEKIVFKLYFRKNLSLNDVSKMLRAPLGTVSSVVSRMRKKFKK